MDMYTCTIYYTCIYILFHLRWIL